MQREMTARERARLYEQAVALIRREYATELFIDDVARRLFTSRRQLQRVFTEAGTGFRTVCRQARMEAAAKLLSANPNVTVKEIARAVGYSQPAQFAKAFQREVGTAPAAFRKSPSAIGVLTKPRRASDPHAARRSEPARRALPPRAARAWFSQPSLERLLGLSGHDARPRL